MSKINATFVDGVMYKIGLVRKGDPASKPTFLGNPITLDGKTLKENYGITSPRELFRDNRLGLDIKKTWRIYGLDEAGKEFFIAEGTPTQMPKEGLADAPIISSPSPVGTVSPYREHNDWLKGENQDLRQQNSQLIATVSSVLEQNSQMMAQLQTLSSERVAAERLAIQLEGKLNEEIKINRLKSETDKEIQGLKDSFAKEKEGLAGLGLIEQALPHLMPVIGTFLDNLINKKDSPAPAAAVQPGPQQGQLQDGGIARYQAMQKRTIPPNGHAKVQEF